MIDTTKQEQERITLLMKITSRVNDVLLESGVTPHEAVAICQILGRNLNSCVIEKKPVEEIVGDFVEIFALAIRKGQ